MTNRTLPAMSLTGSSNYIITQTERRQRTAFSIEQNETASDLREVSVPATWFPAWPPRNGRCQIGQR